MVIRPKIGIVSSCGGHLTEVRCLLPVYGEYEHFYVLNDRVMLPPDMQGRTHFIRHSERDLTLLINLVEAIRILRRERPEILISTGAGPIVPFALIARILGIKILFIETITRVDAPSLTGRIMYRLAHHFFFQHETLSQYFPRGQYVGTVI